MRGINRRLVRKAAAEISGTQDRQFGWGWVLPVFVAAAVGVIAVGIWTARQELPDVAIEVVAQSSTPTLDAAVEPAELIESSSPLAAAPPLDELESEPEPDLNEQLQLASGLTNADSAYATLFELWQIDYEAGSSSACSQAVAARLNCFFQRGSWTGLRQLDRPAILTLTDSDGNDHDVVLTAIDGDRAQLSIGGVNVTHPVNRITELWFGQYVLLWKPPNGSSISLGIGSRGQNVTWLRQSLAAIDSSYSSEPLESATFDDDLARVVRKFQRDHRLSVDGLAGQQTQIVVNSLLALDGTPRLTLQQTVALK